MASRADRQSIREAYRRLLPYLGRYRRQALAIVVLGAVAAFGQKIPIVLLKPMVNRIFPEADFGVESEAVTGTWLGRWNDQVLEPWLDRLDFFGLGQPHSSLLFLVGVLLLSAALFAVIQYVFLRLSRMLAVWMVTDLRQDLAEHVLKLGMRYHSGRRLGDLLSRMTADTGTSLRILNLIIEEIVQEPIAILAGLAVAWAVSPVATAGILVLVPILALPVWKIGPKVRRRSQKSLAALGDTTQSLTQMFSGIRVVKAFRMEEREAREFRRANDAFVRSTERMIKAQAASLAITAFLASGGIGLALGVVALANTPVHGRPRLFQDPGDLVTFAMAMMAVVTSVKRLTKALSVVHTSLGATTRVFEIFDLKPDVYERGDEAPFDGLQREIRFEDVHFRYEGQEESALDGVDFTVRKGERVALVGPSGAGKTTLLDLVARFYDPTSGRILVDGRPLTSIRLADWLDRLAVVSQAPFLFQTTLAENVRYGRPDASDEEVLEALRAAWLEDLVANLPQGVHTEVGEAGDRLSGGQAQRVTIARALLKDPEVLLLDEATSALDSESERRVQKALETLMEGRTVFVIAHRLSTVRTCDRILVLDRGRIVESGTHDELVEAGGMYARMWRLQIEADAPA